MDIASETERESDRRRDMQLFLRKGREGERDRWLDRERERE